MDIVRESGNDHPPIAGDFDGQTRRAAMAALLAKHDCAETEARIAEHYTWAGILRKLGVAVAVALVATTANAQTRQQRAADILRNLNSDANFAKRPAPLPEGPRVFILASTPGALTWQTFTPFSPPVRLDGTPLTQPPTVYGVPYFVHHRW